jgi:hypothetical protein
LPKPASMGAGVDPNHTIAKSMEFINYTKFPYKLLLVSCDGFLENFIGQVLACKSGLKMPFSAFRALLLSTNYSAERSGRVWQPAAENNGRLAHFFKKI